MQGLRLCNKCNKPITNDYLNICDICFHMEVDAGILKSSNPSDWKRTHQFNKPEHYHKHEIDTIEFLKRGFPPQVFMGFAIGHIIKYAQRAEYKNGREDFVKMVDYAKRALDWYDETHEKELGK